MFAFDLAKNTSMVTVTKNKKNDNTVPPIFAFNLGNLNKTRQNTILKHLIKNLEFYFPIFAFQIAKTHQ